MTRWVRAIRHGWVVKDGVPGPDVDEFAEATEVVAALPAARQALDRLRASAYRQVGEVVAPYRADGPDGVAVGVLCLVDSAAVDVHGISRVRHSE